MNSPTFVCVKCGEHVSPSIPVCKCGDIKLDFDNGVTRLAYSSDEAPNCVTMLDPIKLTD